MGNLIKGAKQGQSGNDILDGGVHLVMISSMRYATDENGIYLKKAETGEMALELEFKNGRGKKIKSNFWMTEKSQWVFDNLCKAVEVDNSKGAPSVNELIDKRLWIAIGVQFSIVEGEFEKDTTGKIIRYSKLLPIFMKVHDPLLPPAIEGDPNLNGGVPSGKFLVNKPEEMPYGYGEILKAEMV